MSIQSRLNDLLSLTELSPEQEQEAEGLKSLLFEEEQGQLVECLDDGFVGLVDHMGSDGAIVQAARVSYGAGTKKLSDDRNLIRYLMRHWHTTPFEMVEFKFRVRVPMDCWRQWIRHRMASVNEYSTRYSEAIDSRQTTYPKEWREQSGINKQGSAGYIIDEGHFLTKREEELHALTRTVYEERLKLGVAREQARKDLPLSTYTEAYWKIDLHNLFHFLRLRLDSHAQLEIRTFANAIAQLVEPIVPLAWEAFEDYRLNAMQLSGPEIAYIAQMMDTTGKVGEDKLGKREKAELYAKLGRLNLTPANV